METRVVLLSGKQGSGKDTIAGQVEDKLFNKYHTACTEMKFAQVIYAMHDECIGILEGLGIKRDIKKDGPLLQLLGTEWGRKTIHEDIWVDALKGLLKKTEAMIKEGGYKVLYVFVTDARFPNEIEGIEGALKVRLECPENLRKQRCSMWRENTEHPSETALDCYKNFDVTIDTSKSVEDCTNVLLKAIECHF